MRAIENTVLMESPCHYEYLAYGAIQVLRNADGGGGVPNFPGKALGRCKVLRYYRYETKSVTLHLNGPYYE